MVPRGDGQGRRHEGSNKYTKVDLRWLSARNEEGFQGMGGSLTAFLPARSGLTRQEIKDVGEVGAIGYELLDEDGRRKIEDRRVDVSEAFATVARSGVRGRGDPADERRGGEALRHRPPYPKWDTP